MNRERLLAEFERQLLAWRMGDQKRPTVRSIATGCGVSRQSVYRSHPIVVQKVAEMSGRRSLAEANLLKLDLLREKLKKEVEKVGLLTTLCAELAVALHDVREELAHAQATVKRFRAGRERE